MKRFMRWFANLPLTIVATNCLLAGLVFSAIGLHWMLLVAVVPILAWAVLQRT